MALNLANTDARRRLYISLALKRVRPGSGSSIQTLRARTWRQTVFNLSSIVSVPFVVVGGVATRLYAPERTTDDLDVLVMADDAPQLYRELTAAGCQGVGALPVGGSEWRLTDGTTLNVRESDTEWAREAVQSPVAGPDGLPVICLPYLVLMKMYASRGIDIGDLTRMLGGADDETLHGVRDVVSRHMSDAREDLEILISLGRLEYEPPTD